jgi:hypothetical protein
MASMPKTWRQKLESAPEPHVEVTDKPFIGIPAGVKILISSPLEIRDVIDGIPKGSSMTVAEMRETLAKKHRAKVTCPLTTGIFLRIVAEAALDEFDEGKAVSRITPFWRVVGPKDKVAKKIRCGPEFIAERRKAERIT